MTYPRCDVPPQAVLEYLQEKHQIKEYVICREEHQDGTPHVHAFVKVVKKISFKHDLFDLPEHHGHYEVAKSWKAVQKYVTKDGNYISSFDIDSARAKTGKKNKEVLAMPPKQAVEEGLIRWD